MKTENLIEVLVADRTARSRPMGRLLAGALAVGAAASLAIFLVALGVRADIAEALVTWRFELKVALVLLALGLAFSLCVSLSRPVAPSHAGRRLVPLAALAVAAVAMELAILPSAAWVAQLVGSNAVICLTAIPPWQSPRSLRCCGSCDRERPPRPRSLVPRPVFSPRRPGRRSMPFTASTIRRCSSSRGTSWRPCRSSLSGRSSGAGCCVGERHLRQSVPNLTYPAYTAGSSSKARPCQP